jgi:hypothetical protein
MVDHQEGTVYKSISAESRIQKSEIGEDPCGNAPHNGALRIYMTLPITGTLFGRVRQ